MLKAITGIIIGVVWTVATVATVATDETVRTLVRERVRHSKMARG
jgi:hypothetical protein